MAAFARSQAKYSNLATPSASAIELSERGQPLKPHGNTGIQRNSLRRFHKNAIQTAGRTYDTSTSYTHHDAWNRFTKAPMEDIYISSNNGALRELIVQCSPDVISLQNDVTWARTPAKSAASSSLRLSIMPYRVYKEQGLPMAIIAWAGAAVALCFTLVFPVLKKSHGSFYRYHPFLYRFHGYAKSPLNPRESQIEGGSQFTRAKDADLDQLAARNTGPSRTLRPQRLCVKKQIQDGSRPFEVLTVDEWRARRSYAGDMLSNQLEEYPQYLFISYTSAQFNSEEDIDVLEYISGLAADYAGVEAFWLGSHCLAAGEEEDVYRINDYVRMSSGVVVILGHPPQVTQPSYDRATMKQLLHQWGERVWTFPEILLAPDSMPIQVWTRGLEDRGPEQFRKDRFPDMAWSDSQLSRVLVDGMQNTLTLSRLEKAVLALRCFQNRSLVSGSKPFHHPGDRAYAMAGLLSQRPEADGTDSEFEAFARLSLANDSDRLLERMICIQPKSIDHTWQTLKDAWDANIWDISPHCQVSGIGERDTVIIDGARGAIIRWKSFKNVQSISRSNWRRSLARLMVHSIPGIILMGIVLLASGSAIGGAVSDYTYESEDSVGLSNEAKILQAVGGVIFAIGMIGVSLAPMLVRTLYGGKSYGNECWLFGVEGHMPIDQIERYIWGDARSRLRWTPYASPLSRHLAVKAEDHVECHGIDPTTDTRMPSIAEEMGDLRRQGLRIFTLVDTHTMTVTLFAAEIPPVALLVCGEEGGMQRAVGVSYDWTTETLYRETVLRLESTVLDKMARVSRCQLGLKRPADGKWKTFKAGRKDDAGYV